MRSRLTVGMLVVLGLIAGAIAIRSGVSSRVPSDQADNTDSEAPVVAPSRVVSENGETRVVLDTADIRRLGLTTARLVGAGSETGRRLSGQVVPEPERTVTVRAPVSGRLAGVEGRRWPSLGERLTAGTTIGRVSDAQPLAVPLAGMVTAIGARPGEIVEAGQVLLELADNTHPVVRIAWPEDTGRAPDRLLLLPAGGEKRIEATLIGPAAEADPVTRFPAYLFRARMSWPGAVPGTAVSALVPDGGKTGGALVPDQAVVQWEGLAWAYIQRGAGRYVRVRVATNRPAPGGWVTGPPLAPGDTVVVAGVQELLSEEFRAGVTVGEESGE